MAITVVNSSNLIEGISTTSVTSSPSFNSTGGNTLVAGGTYWSNVTTTEGSPAFSDNGSNTWVPDPSSEYTPAGEFLRCDIGYAKGIAGTTGQTATYTESHASEFPNICLLEVSGLDPSNPVDVAASYTQVQANTLNSSLLTPTAGQRLIVFVGQCDGATSQGVTNNGTGAATWTVIKDDSSTAGQPGILAYAIVTANGTSTYGVTYTGINNTTAMCGIKVFKAGVSGPPVGGLIEPMQNTRGLLIHSAARQALPW